MDRLQYRTALARLRALLTVNVTLEEAHRTVCEEFGVTDPVLAQALAEDLRVKPARAEI